MRVCAHDNVYVCAQAILLSCFCCTLSRAIRHFTVFSLKTLHLLRVRVCALRVHMCACVCVNAQLLSGMVSGVAFFLTSFVPFPRGRMIQSQDKPISRPSPWEQERSNQRTDHLRSKSTWEVRRCIRAHKDTHKTTMRKTGNIHTQTQGCLHKVQRMLLNRCYLSCV